MDTYRLERYHAETLDDARCKKVVEIRLGGTPDRADEEQDSRDQVGGATPELDREGGNRKLCSAWISVCDTMLCEEV